MPIFPSNMYWGLSFVVLQKVLVFPHTDAASISFNLSLKYVFLRASNNHVNRVKRIVLPMNCESGYF